MIDELLIHSCYKHNMVVRITDLFIIGVPKPVITWFRDGKLIKEDGGCRLYSKGDEYFLEIPGYDILFDQV